MKKYSLVCEHDHEFEGWFADADAIRQQLQAGLLDCPYCGSSNLEKRLSAPNLSTPKTRTKLIDQQQDVPSPPASLSMPNPETADVKGLAAALAPSAAEGAAALRMAVRALHRKIEAEFTNVGHRFAEEARKIHEGSSEEQNIYGSCTAEEQRELSEDGIDILSIPELPPEH